MLATRAIKRQLPVDRADHIATYHSLLDGHGGFFAQLPSNTDMKTMLKISVVTFVLAMAGCTGARQDVDRTSLETPVQVQLGGAGSPSGPIQIRSGQLISLPLCCPPVELRDANGRLVQELESTRAPQALVADTGTYSIVGHDPAGGECVLRLEVTKK